MSKTVMRERIGTPRKSVRDYTSRGIIMVGVLGAALVSITARAEPDANLAYDTAREKLCNAAAKMATETEYKLAALISGWEGEVYKEAEFYASRCPRPRWEVTKSEAKDELLKVVWGSTLLENADQELNKYERVAKQPNLGGLADWLRKRFDDPADSRFRPYMTHVE